MASMPIGWFILGKASGLKVFDSLVTLELVFLILILLTVADSFPMKVIIHGLLIIPKPVTSTFMPKVVPTIVSNLALRSSVVILKSKLVVFN